MKFYGTDIASIGQRRLRPGFIDDPLFLSFLDALPDGAAVLEIDGTIKLVNNRFEKLMDLPKGEIVGTEIVKHATTGGPVIHKVAAALKQLKRLDVSGPMTSQRFVAASLNYLRTADGGAYAALLVLREPNRVARGTDSVSDRFRFQNDAPLRPSAAYISTPPLQELMKRGTAALDRGASILIAGESGTGKTEFVRRLCKESEQGSYPFVHVNCGMLGDGVFEVEMFGIESGSALDAQGRGKLGFVEAADGGVLFLDQIADLSPQSQIKLLAFLENGVYSRIGSSQRRQVKIRIVAAANRPLTEMIAAGTFRADLYYRIAVVTLALPPIRGDAALIGEIAESFFHRINVGRKPPLAMSDEFRSRLLSYDYPGNIRELNNILDHAASSAAGSALPEHFVVPIDMNRTAAARPSPVTEELEADNQTSGFKELIQEFETYVLEKSIAQNGSKRSAAKALGIDIATLIRKLNRKR